MTRKSSKEDNLCWQAVRCTYDNYEMEPDDDYGGDVFGRLTNFESPHWLYRRFHRNFCKAFLISKLDRYFLRDDPDDPLFSQFEEISTKYRLDIIARHNSLVLMISAVENFLKDSFMIILEHIYPNKKKKQKPKRILRRYSFQNLDSILRAFEWLCPNFKTTEILIIRHPDDFSRTIDISPHIRDMLKKRNKIIHESKYFEDFSNNLLGFYAFLCISCVDQFDFFFEDSLYYERLEEIIHSSQINNSATAHH